MKRLGLFISLFLITLSGFSQEYFSIIDSDGFEYKYVRQKSNMRLQLLVSDDLTEEQYIVKTFSHYIESLHKNYKYDNGDLTILSPDLKKLIVNYFKYNFKIDKVYIYDSALDGSVEQFEKITGIKGIYSTLTVSELVDNKVLNYWYLNKSKNKTWFSDFKKNQLSSTGYDIEAHVFVECVGNWNSIYMFLK